MSTNIGNRILRNFEKRIAKDAINTRCGRVDLQMTDFEMLSPTEAAIMLEYNRGVGTPRKAQVGEWVTAAWKGDLRVEGNSILHYPDLNVVTATIVPTTLAMPMNKRLVSGMLRVGAAAYMDAHESIWEVREGDKGKYLLRVSQDNVEDLLTERLNRMTVGSLHHSPKFSHIITAGISDPSVGDHVEFLDTKTMTRKYGKVTKVSKDNVTISVGNESVTTDRQNLIAVTKQSPQSIAEDKKMQEEFYAEYLFSGDHALARKLMK